MRRHARQDGDDAGNQYVQFSVATNGMGDEGALVHHSDRGAQYLSIRKNERLAEAGTEPLVGRVGDSYDNVLAESIIGLYKTQVIRQRGL